MSEDQRPAPWRCEIAVYPGGVMWLALSGVLDRDLASKLKAALARARFVVVDLAGLDSIDPAGLRALMDVQTYARRVGARLVIARPRR